LKILTADNNFMNSILDFGPINIKIEILRLRNCGISYIHPFAFRALEKLTYLDVANNKISHINGSAFHRASGLLYFSGGTNNIISLAGTFSRTRKLLSLNVSYNVIDDVTDAFTQLVVLRKLMLRNNRIKYIRDGTFRNNGNLKYLDLAENRIEWLGKRAFSGLVNLDLLSVSDNFLLHLNGSVSHMPQLRILNFSHNAIQTLYGNDFYNDPELTFIYAYGNNLSTIEGAFQTSPKLRMFLACALTASTAYLKYKREIKVWLYARGLCSRLQCIKEDDLDDDKLFDVFLSFSSKDSNWAYNELIPKIESHGFSICTYDRNFKGGYLVQDIIHEAVACSRRILLLLTENFVESEWCRWEFRVAHHRALEDNTNRLIVVLVDEVTSDAVDEELRRYMQVTNFLRWGESHFWDKLLYSLPKKDSQRRLIPSSQEYASSHL
ncbi:toll, putative, partial [Ixodes scapularis]